MKKTFIATLLALATVTAFSQTAAPAKEFGWTEIASNTSRAKVYSIKDKSVAINKNNRGDTIVVGVGKTYDTATNRSEVNKWYVSLTDCEAEVGMLTILETDGKFVNDIAFAFNQGSVGAAIAETLCSVYKQATSGGTTKGKSV
jgi:hypothetical protein